MNQIQQLQAMIDQSSSIVFLAVPAYPPKAASRISAVWTAFTTSSMTIPRRRS